jgi:hypothetical protein
MSYIICKKLNKIFKHLDIPIKYLNRTILENMFSSLLERDTLNLSNLGIETIHIDTFNGLNRLENLILKKNNLNYINFNFKDLYQLKMISLESNHIVQLSK